MDRPAIFSREARRQRRARILRYSADDRWLLAHMAGDLLERLAGVRRQFARALVVGSDFGLLEPFLSAAGTLVTVTDTSPTIAASIGGVACDEDRLPFADDTFDLVLSLGVLDTVDDLPGALILIRRALTPDGLFLASLSGAGGLVSLRRGFASDSGIARFHPQIDARAAGDLLARAGFTLPVAEIDMVTARYRSIERLFSDLRANGLTNVLARRFPLRRSDMENAASTLQPPIEEQFSILTLTGWKQGSQ